MKMNVLWQLVDNFDIRLNILTLLLVIRAMRVSFPIVVLLHWILCFMPC